MSINQIRSRDEPFLARNSQFGKELEVCEFIQEMNRNCCRLNLRSTFFDSPHGMMNPLSRSTAYDIAKLSAAAMEDPTIRRVVSTKNYNIPRSLNQNKRTYRWENTHKMIGQPGILGIKTGITNSAGPCLSTAIEAEHTQMIIVLLNCKNMDIRWPETNKLSDWADKRMMRINQFKQELKHHDKMLKTSTNIESCNTKILSRLKHL